MATKKEEIEKQNDTVDTAEYEEFWLGGAKYGREYDDYFIFIPPDCIDEISKKDYGDAKRAYEDAKKAKSDLKQGEKPTVTIYHSFETISAPYEKDFICEVKKLGGQWEPESKVWLTVKKQEQVKELVKMVYGKYSLVDYWPIPPILGH